MCEPPVVAKYLRVLLDLVEDDTAGMRVKQCSLITQIQIMHDMKFRERRATEPR
eukprot:CAMPEP_0181227790 /NCGR_PEP_ID=MMETSP1096-20121128/32983_1 /TAXON_ID=156174 ORGANISM="Chrysochromulina ericina, Strain CCMP281" /NCGR_SAMPLE_ID=MMETSP1096 /ASSEMBLY_ACC=CAM_ASM_000453 /LENGTH=53 /DNA_ID=CAMNT_0023321233 /DNA_START=772 /DNA_END=933 /DNA_ORIENTATION=-